MNDDLKTGIGIAFMFLGVAVVIGIVSYANNVTPTLNGRAVILYVENGQPAAKWATEGNSK